MFRADDTEIRRTILGAEEHPHVALWPTVIATDDPQLVLFIGVDVHGLIGTSVAEVAAAVATIAETLRDAILDAQ